MEKMFLDKTVFPDGLVVLRNREVPVTRTLHRNSGYRAKPYRADNGRLSIWLELSETTVPIVSTRVWYSSIADDKAEAEQERQLCLWQAVARYLNTGGELADFRDDMTRAMDMLEPMPLAGNFRLLATQQNMELDNPRHIFCDPETREAVVFVEDQYVESTTMDAMAASIKAYREGQSNADPEDSF